MIGLIPTYYKYIAFVVAVGLLTLGAKLYVNKVEQKGYERGKAEVAAEADKQSLALALAYAERIKTAQEERDANQIIVNRLSADARRLRIHIPTADCLSVANGANTDGTSRVLSAGIDEAFGRLQQGIAGLAERCDELNLDAIRLNESLPPSQ